MNLARLLLLISGDSGGGIRAIAEMDAGLDSLGGGVDRASGKFGLLGAAMPIIAGIAAALIGVGAVSVKMAGDFQAQMRMVQTQAHATGYDINDLSQKLLVLAPQLGYGPTELATSLYHVASAGIPASQALDVVTASAKLAQIGQADLEDSTQAVIGVMSAMGGQFKTASDAAAMLNAIVGTGDMKMQQLDKAIGTGILPTAATYGLTLKDVGAALATITDNVTPADEAATRLKTAFTMLGAPTHEAQLALGAVGINSTQLADDMRKPNGLLLAVTDLHDHLGHIDVSGFAGGIAKAKSDLEHFGLTTDQVNQMVGKMGPSATEQAVLIARAFGGGRSSAAIMTLLTEFDKFSGKYAQLDQGVGKFGSDWEATTQNFNFQVAQMRAGLDSVVVSIGTKLIPVASSAVGSFAGMMPAIQHGVEGALDAIAKVIDRVQTFGAAGGVAGGTTGLLMALGVDPTSASQIGQTVSLIVSNFKQASTEVVPALHAIGDTLTQVVIPALRVAVPIVLGLALQLSSMLGPALQFVAQHADLLRDVVIALLARFAVLKGIEFTKNAIDGFGKMVTAAQNAAKFIGGAWQTLRDLPIWAQLYGEAALNWAKTSAAAVASAARSAAAWVADGARIVATFVAARVAAVVNAAQMAGAWLAAHAAMAAATARTVAQVVLLNVWEGIVKVATIGWNVVQAILDAELWANPIGLVVLAIVALVAIVVLVITHWQTLTTWLREAWNWFGQVVSAVQSTIEKNQVLSDILSTLFGPIGTLVQLIQGLVSHWQDVTNAVGGALSALGNFANWLSGGGISHELQGLVQDAQKAASALNSINPFAQHSPSLVQNVQAGTRIISDQYGTMASEIVGHASTARTALQQMTAVTSAGGLGGLGGGISGALAGAGGGSFGAGAAGAAGGSLASVLQQLTTLLRSGQLGATYNLNQPGANAEQLAQAISWRWKTA